ncbi:MAG: NAD(+) synthase, partial [Endomicrobiia bacterium]
FTTTQVLQLAKILSVPQKIISKPPSAGLWQGQTDEGEMGITYDQLDKIIEYIDNKKKFTYIDKKLFHKVISTKQKNQHKLNPPKMFKL